MRPRPTDKVGIERLRLPAPIEARLRKKWSRRAKLIGYTLVLAYVGLMIWFILATEVSIGVVIAGGSAIAVGYRYLQAARHLEKGHETAVDIPTRQILERFQQRVRQEGAREVIGGALSEPVDAGEAGELSVTGEAGSLSETPPRDPD